MTEASKSRVVFKLVVMPISSYVLRTEQKDPSAILKALGQYPWVTIGEPAENGIPVVVESQSEHDAQGKGDLLTKVPGVSSAVLVYHNFEDLENCPCPSSTKITES